MPPLPRKDRDLQPRRGRLAAEKLGVAFLGEVPIDPAIREGGDNGVPIVVANPQSPQAQAFTKIAKTLAGLISVQNSNSLKLTIIQ